MAIHFEEVTGEIEPPRRTEAGQEPPRQPDRPEDQDARLERALRLRAERLARLDDR